MNQKSFKPRTLTETLSLLCFAKGGEFLRNGKPNQSEIARQAGTSQGNISRWYSGESKAKDENINRLAKAFRVTPAQMRGEQPILSLDGVTAESNEDKIFIEHFHSLPAELQELVRAQVAAYKKLNDQAK